MRSRLLMAVWQSCLTATLTVGTPAMAFDDTTYRTPWGNTPEPRWPEASPQPGRPDAPGEPERAQTPAPASRYWDAPSGFQSGQGRRPEPSRSRSQPDPRFIYPSDEESPPTDFDRSGPDALSRSSRENRDGYGSQPPSRRPGSYSRGRGADSQSHPDAYRQWEEPPPARSDRYPASGERGGTTGNTRDFRPPRPADASPMYGEPPLSGGERDTTRGMEKYGEERRRRIDPNRESGWNRSDPRWPNRNQDFPEERDSGYGEEPPPAGGVRAPSNSSWR